MLCPGLARGVSLVLAAVLPLAAGDIAGHIIIHRKLTKRKVTNSVSAYQRGVAVELATDSGADPLAFERSHVVIYLDGPLRPESGSAVLEQKNRRFVPELLVVSAGSTVTFPNRDLILHNVFSLSKAKSFDLGTYPKDQTRTVVLSKPGIVYVNCHLHPNMAAAIVVTPNRWFTVADASGRFTIRDVPAGVYTAVAWHKAAGSFRAQVRVEKDGAASVDFIIPFSTADPLQAAALEGTRR
jgi:plastocyanin